MQNRDFFGTKLGHWSRLGPSPEFGTLSERMHTARTFINFLCQPSSHRQGWLQSAEHIPAVFSEPKRKMQSFQTGSPLPARMAAMARPIRLDQQDCLTLAQVIQGNQSEVAIALQILRSFSAPITEEHAWAVIHQVCESCHLDHIFCGL